MKKGDIIEVLDPSTNDLVVGRIEQINRWQVAIIVEDWGNVAWAFRVNLINRIVKES